MTVPMLPMTNKQWSKIERSAIEGTIAEIYSGELNGITRRKARSRGGQVVHGMANYVAFLCIFDVPLATQITLLRKWVKWGFDMCRPTYLRYVKEIIGEEEYQEYQMRAWMCQRFETIRAAKALFDAKKTDEAVAFLKERRVIGTFANRFGNQTVEIELQDVLGFIEIYDSRGFFDKQKSKGSVSFQKFQERQNCYLKAILEDLNHTSTEDFIRQEREIIKHGINRTGVLLDKTMDVDTVVEKAHVRAAKRIHVPEAKEPQAPVAASPVKEEHVVLTPKETPKPTQPVLDAKEQAKQAWREEIEFTSIKKAMSGKTVAEPFWAFKKLAEAQKEPYVTDIKVNDLVLTYGIDGKFFAYRKNKEGELVMIDKLSMHPLLQAHFDNRRQEIKPPEFKLIMGD